MILTRILKPKQVIQTKLRLKHRIMSPISPPPEVRGITEWQPELFNTTALIPSLSVNNDQIGTVRKSLEKYLLKVNNLKPVQDCAKFPGRRSLLLNPEDISSFRDLEPMQKQLEQCFVKREHFRYWNMSIAVFFEFVIFSIRKFDLTVDNWTPHEVLKAVLPPDEEGVSGFSTIGHIVHLNLRYSSLL